MDKVNLKIKKGAADKKSEFIWQKGQRLSPREVEVLMLLANGKSREEITQILPIKAVTVRAYLETARTKLNATSILHAATIATARGLIELFDSTLLKTDSNRSENTKACKNLVLGREPKKIKK